MLPRRIRKNRPYHLTSCHLCRLLMLLQRRRTCCCNIKRVSYLVLHRHINAGKHHTNIHIINNQSTSSIHPIQYNMMSNKKIKSLPHDVLIITNDNEEIPCYKTPLCQQSTVFDTICSNTQYKETTSSPIPRIKVPVNSVVCRLEFIL